MKTIFVCEGGQVIRKSGDGISVTLQGKTQLKEAIINVSGIVIMGNAQITEQALRLSAQHNITIIHASKTGSILAITNSFAEKRCTLRLMQYDAYTNSDCRLELAKWFCKQKVQAQGEFLRKRRAPILNSPSFIDAFDSELEACASINEILGIEGRIASAYFTKLRRFSPFRYRSRRPAKDVMNSLLNLSYSLLLHRICCVLLSQGFDLQIGYLHSIRNGRPSLALDVLELFRSDADSFVITALNRKEFTWNDFVVNPEKGGVYLSKKAFNKFMNRFSASCLDDAKIEFACLEVKRLIIEKVDAHDKTATFCCL